MTRIISLLLIGSLIIASNVLTKSEIITENESLDEAEIGINSPRLFESLFISLTECLREKIKEGITIFRIKKSLDPLQIRIPIPLRFKKDVLRGQLTLRKFRLEGLAGFELTKGTVSVTKTVSFGLKFNKIKLTSKYKAKLTLFGFMDIYGKGTLNIELNNFDIDSKVKVKTLPSLRLTDLFLNVTLPATHAVVTGLFNDEHMSDLISRQLTDTLTTLAEEEHDRFNAVLNNFGTTFIENIVNPALKELSISDLLAIMEGLSKNCEESLLYIIQMATTFIMDISGIDSELLYSGDNSHYEEDKF